MAPTPAKRTKLTVGELHATISKTVATLDRLDLEGEYKAMLTEVDDLRAFLDDVIASSHMGTALDEVILTLDTTEYEVWYRVRGEQREQVILVDATTLDEAQTIAARSFAGGRNVEILRGYARGQIALMERVAGELRKRGIEASYEYPGYIAFPGDDRGGQQTNYAFGTAAETWGGNRVAEDGEIIGATFDFPEFRSDDLTLAPSLIAERIAKAVRS